MKYVIVFNPSPKPQCLSTIILLHTHINYTALIFLQHYSFSQLGTTSVNSHLIADLGLMKVLSIELFYP